MLTPTAKESHVIFSLSNTLRKYAKYSTCDNKFVTICLFLSFESDICKWYFKLYLWRRSMLGNFACFLSSADFFKINVY